MIFYFWCDETETRSYKIDIKQDINYLNKKTSVTYCLYTIFISTNGKYADSIKKTVYFAHRKVNNKL